MPQFKSGLLGVFVALFATVSALLVRRLILVPVFGVYAPRISFAIVVGATTWVSGKWFGVFATLLAASATIYLGIDDSGFKILPLIFQRRLPLFVAIGVFISWLVDSRQSARRRVEDRQKQLEVEVTERRKAEAALIEQREQLMAEMSRREAAELVLREQGERIRLALESTNIGTFDFNTVTGERNWSDRFKEMFGLSADADVSNLSFRDRIHADDRKQVNRAMERAFDPNGDGACETDCRLIWPDGSVHSYIVRGQTLFEGQGLNRRPIRFLGTVLDITERKHADEIIRASENRLRAIMDNTSAVIYLKDLQHRYLMINRRYEELFNVTQQQIVGKTDAEVFPIDVVAKLQANDQQVSDTGHSLEFEESVPHPDGPHTYFTVKFPVKDASGTVVAVGGISTDVSDRKRAADALKEEQDVLRHTIEFQDQERELIASEIHDGLVQYATGALMQLEAVQPHVVANEVAERIDSIVDILRRTVAEGRRLMNGFRPPVLDDWGVVAAVEHLIDEEERAHVEIQFIRDDSLGRLAPRTEETLYRITQEALTNIRKHSQSRKIRIELGRQGNRVHLEIQDWGVGFTPTNGSVKGHGLRGMAQRARIAGGECKIESSPGGGTQIAVDLPFAGRD